MYVKFQAKPTDVVILQVYTSNEDAIGEEKENFYWQLEYVLAGNKRDTDNVIVVGDFNAKLGEECIPDRVGPYRSRTRNDNRERLIACA